MAKLLKVPIIFNKKNGQVSLPLPKKKLKLEDKAKMSNSRFARIWFEGFE